MLSLLNPRQLFKENNQLPASLEPVGARPRTNSEDLGQVLDSLEQAILIITAQFEIEYLNSAAKKLLEVGDLNTTRLWEKVVGNKIFQSKGVVFSPSNLQKVFQSGQKSTFDIGTQAYVQNSLGKVSYVTITLIPEFLAGQVNRVIVTINDVSVDESYYMAIQRELRKRSLLIQAEHIRLVASINSLNLGFIITDQEGKAIIINDAAKLMICATYPDQQPGVYYNYRYVNLSSVTVEMMHDKLRGVVDLKGLIKQGFADRKPFEFKEVFYNNLYLRIQIRPIVFVPEDIQILGMVVIFEDITKEKVLEKTKDDFFSIASHELRTPLTAIRGNTSLIMQYFVDKLNDPSLKEMISDIHESSIRLIGIVNDFLDTSRLEQSRMQFKLENFDISELVKEVLAELKSVALEKHLTLIQANSEGSQLPLVYADKNRVKQVVINLVGNAIKFTDQGSISVRFEVLPDRLKVYILDSGKGISPSNQGLLFKKFLQAQESNLNHDSNKGTGLGLYISKLIIEKMGGKIQLESSAEGKGSTFSFTLPIQTNQLATLVS